MGRKPEANEVRIVWFGLSGGCGLANLTERQMGTVFAINSEGEEFKCLNPEHVEYVFTASWLRFLHIPASLNYQLILGACCNIAIARDIVGNTCMRLINYVSDQRMN